MSLPNGYKRLEYIQSTGTQYIDTNVKFASSNIKFYIKWQDLSSYSGKCVFGTGSDTNKGYFVCYENYLYIGAGQVAALGISDTSVPHELSIETTSSGSLSYSLDGTVTSGAYTAPVNSAYSLYLLNQNPMDRCRTAKLYSCKIYDNGTLIRDFIPCQTTSGDIGLWDDVNSAFYGNAGTGTFTAGPVIASPSIFVNIDGIWKPINHIYVNINNIWQKST